MVSGNPCDGTYFAGRDTDYTKRRGNWPDECPNCGEDYHVATHIPLVESARLPAWGNDSVCLVETDCRAHHYGLYWHTKPNEAMRLRITISDTDAE